MSGLRKPHVLIILDGWGYREETDHNAIAHANTPTCDKLWHERPHTLISGSGMDVGLPKGQMGNSEVGHMNLGAGRVVYQDFTRITKSIENKEFFENPALTSAIDQAISTDKAVHIMGLLSPGGVHSHEDHIDAMIKMAADRGARQIFVHGFLDGRDTPPKSAATSIQKIDSTLTSLGVGRIASLTGRYFAMDRDNRWDRVESAYDLLTLGKAEFRADKAIDGLLAAYQRGETDEFVSATAIAGEGESAATVGDGDALIFMNFRADRARQLTRSFTESDFEGFVRKTVPRLGSFTMLTQYAADITAGCAFTPNPLTNILGEIISRESKTQLRVAETEKYAHVTFFFNGGREAPFEGEDRKLIPSPDVATYDLKPEMSASAVTSEMVKAITGGKYDVIVCNYANGDMVGHTGNFKAAVKAAETIDHSLKQIVTALDTVNGECLITADHGNCEQMADEKTDQPHTAHTCELIPLIYIGNKELQLQEKGGTLADIAPTILDLMDTPQPKEMSGQSLLIKNRNP